MCLHYIIVFLFWYINEKALDGISYIFMIGYEFYVIADVLYFFGSLS